MSVAAVGQSTRIQTSPARRPCIHEVFEAQVSRSPDAIAANQGERSVRYRELNEQANRLAAYLRSCGVGPEVPVALYLERTPLMVVAILGVLKAGGAYVPIDLAYPRERAAFMLKDTGAPVLLTQEKLGSAIPENVPNVFCLDRDWPKIANQSSENFSSGAEPDNAAYIIYTSGSTGTPKGVIVTHDNVVRLLQQTHHWYGFNESDVWPLFHSYAFDVSVWELWGSLFNGGRLVVVPYLITRSPAEFYELLSREKVTVLNQTPSAFRQLIWAEQVAPEKLPLHLRYVVCAGEALELQSLKPWFDLHGDEKPRIVNMYGITETTVHSTYRVIRKADLDNGLGSVVGVPIPDLQIYLVDDELKPVAKGVPGEICVGGAGVARGYLNRPELTKARFLPDPFSNEPGARMYRSGDLAQFTADGELEYLGRLDHQVKIRGFRVELGEIESALNKHPAIRESVVVPREGSGGDKRLVAYIVPRGASPNIGQLRQHLASCLPEYMLPAVFVPLKGLPLTTNGKVDRRALPAPGGSRPDLATAYVTPRNPTEEKLAQIWSQVLEVDRVGVHDNFFELGGDSIRCITVLSQAENAGIHLTLAQVFQSPTIAALAEQSTVPGSVISHPPKPTEPFSLISAEDRAKLPDDVEDAYPISRLQLGMFFHNELNPASAMYHDVFSYALKAPFRHELLKEAIRRLVARHPILRTSFHIVGYSEPLQLVHRTAVAAFTFENLNGSPEVAQQRKIVEWVDAEKRRPFDRTTAPMVRFHVQVQSEAAFQFIFSFHHCCLDGWSLAAAVTEIFQDYCSLLEGSDQQLPAPRATYRDFIGLELNTIRTPATSSFWTHKLEGGSLQELPRWPKESCSGGLEQKRGPEVQIEPNILAGLKRLAQLAGVPLKSVLLGAHYRVMSTLVGQNDVTSALIANGRPEQVDGEKLLGLFLNSVPLRIRLEGGTWVDLARQAFAAEQEMLAHRRFPLAEIQKLLGHRPFETAFDFVHFHVLKNLQERSGLDVLEGHYFEANDLTTYTTFMLDLTSTQLELHIDYDPNIVPRRQIEDITGYYVRILQAMALTPEGRYERFSALSEAEQRRILVEWNSTEQDYPRSQCIHQLFEVRVSERPDATAVSCDGRTLTYRELDSLANRIARTLQLRGAGPNTLVGVFLDRSPEMVAALMGILKTGAAYVPLDPAYPAQRLSFMLEDAAVPAVITETKLQNQLPATAAQVVCVDDPKQIGSAEAPSIPDSGFCRPDSESPAYVIYTSGSTGKPKGVRVAHRSVVNLLLSAADKTGFSARDNFLAVTTLSFDIAGLELFMPLITGSRITLVPSAITGDAVRLAALIESSGATFMQGTPALWRLLLEAGWKGNPNLKIFCGGEALKRALADDLLSRAAEVWNFYGPTETTIWSTAWKVEPAKPVSIGRPLANTRVYILDHNSQPLPPCAAGELLIGGDGVALGYLNRHELTAEKFIPDPFSTDSGARLYRTGDLARWLPDGTLECLGRLDYQVKVRGFRIEPGEIEAALRQHQGIADALVMAHSDRGGEQRLVSYFVSRNGTPTAVELRDFLRGRVPGYMIPAQFIGLKEWPLTPNGKLDRKRLPAPGGTIQAESTSSPPRTADEKQIAEIWKEVLMLASVGIDDNFFELGGDSLSATRAFARINRAFGSNVTLREMLENPTIARLATVLHQLKQGPGLSTAAIPRLPRPF